MAQFEHKRRNKDGREVVTYEGTPDEDPVIARARASLAESQRLIDEHRNWQADKTGATDPRQNAVLRGPPGRAEPIGAHKPGTERMQLLSGPAPKNIIAARADEEEAEDESVADGGVANDTRPKAQIVGEMGGGAIGRMLAGKKPPPSTPAPAARPAGFLASASDMIANATADVTGQPRPGSRGIARGMKAGAGAARVAAGATKPPAPQPSARAPAAKPPVAPAAIEEVKKRSPLVAQYLASTMMGATPPQKDEELEAAQGTRDDLRLGAGLMRAGSQVAHAGLRSRYNPVADQLRAEADAPVNDLEDRRASERRMKSDANADQDRVLAMEDRLRKMGRDDLADRLAQAKDKREQEAHERKMRPAAGGAGGRAPLRPHLATQQKDLASDTAMTNQLARNLRLIRSKVFNPDGSFNEGAPGVGRTDSMTILPDELKSNDAIQVRQAMKDAANTLVYLKTGKAATEQERNALLDSYGLGEDWNGTAAAATGEGIKKFLTDIEALQSNLTTKYQPEVLESYSAQGGTIDSTGGVPQRVEEYELEDGRIGVWDPVAGQAYIKDEDGNLVPYEG